MPAVANMSVSNHGQDLALKWNPKNLEIKTRTVERTLEPLVMQVGHAIISKHTLFSLLCIRTQVTTLVASKSPQKKKGKSKRAVVLVAAVERATENFVERGELIARENPDI